MNGFYIGDLHIQKPIIQGGMGVAISLSGLASAVANQGGIGVISAVGIGMTEPDYKKNFRQANLVALRKEIRKARALSDGVLGVNIMLAVTDFDDLLKVSLEENIDVVFLGAGLPLKLPECINNTDMNKCKTKFIPKVSSFKAVATITKYWDRKYAQVPDGFVIEGVKAGGHLGFGREEISSGLDNLSQAVRQAAEFISYFEKKYDRSIPIIAAGGVYSGKDMYKIMQAGAKAVKMGTRFVTTDECDADIKFKQSYINANEDDLTIIQSPVGMPGRAIRNKFLDEVESGARKPYKCYWRCLKTCDYKSAPYCIAQALFNAAQGKLDEGFSFAGSKAYLADKIISVRDLFAELESEYAAEELNVQQQKSAV